MSKGEELACNQDDNEIINGNFAKPIFKMANMWSYIFIVLNMQISQIPGLRNSGQWHPRKQTSQVYSQFGIIN